MDSEIHVCLNTGGGQKLCNVHKSHSSFSFKLFELFPKSGVTHSPTTKATVLPLLNSLHCFRIHDHVILMVKPSIPKASLNVVIAQTGMSSFVFRSNQSAADRARIMVLVSAIGYLITWEKHLLTAILCHHYNVTIKVSMCIQVGKPSILLLLHYFLQLSQKWNALDTRLLRDIFWLRHISSQRWTPTADLMF